MKSLKNKKMTILTINKKGKSKNLNIKDDLTKHYPPGVLSAAGTLLYSKNKKRKVGFSRKFREGNFRYLILKRQEILNCLKEEYNNDNPDY